MEINNLAPIFRLKRKWNDNPVETLSISIKRSKKDNKSPSGGDESLIQELQLAKSSGQPNVPEFSNVPCHDLNLIAQNCESSSISHSGFEELVKDSDILTVGEPGCSKSNIKETDQCPIVTCNNRPMLRLKTKRGIVKTPFLGDNDQKMDCGEGDEKFVYDFYVPKNYDSFKHGLPDKLCKIITEDMFDGVISINACKREVFNGQLQQDEEHAYEEQAQNSHHMIPDLIQNCPENDTERLLCKLGLNSGSENSSPRADDDEDSNEESNWRNDYPDEDKDLDFYSQNFGPFDDDYGFQSYDENLTSKFENIEVDDDEDFLENEKDNY